MPLTMIPPLPKILTARRTPMCSNTQTIRQNVSEAWLT